MRIEIKIINYTELRHLSKLFTAEQVAAKNDTTIYMGLFNAGILIGFVGLLNIGEGKFRYKSDWVDSNFRGMGIYSKLWQYREKFVAENYPDEIQISAYCTEMSLPKYLSEGFKVQNETTKKIKYVKR